MVCSFRRVQIRIGRSESSLKDKVIVTRVVFDSSICWDSNRHRSNTSIDIYSRLDEEQIPFWHGDRHHDRFDELNIERVRNRRSDDMLDFKVLFIARSDRFIISMRFCLLAKHHAEIEFKMQFLCFIFAR